MSFGVTMNANAHDIRIWKTATSSASCNPADLFAERAAVRRGHARRRGAPVKEGVIDDLEKIYFARVAEEAAEGRMSVMLWKTHFTTIS